MASLTEESPWGQPPTTSGRWDGVAKTAIGAVLSAGLSFVVFHLANNPQQPQQPSTVNVSVNLTAPVNVAVAPTSAPKAEPAPPSVAATSSPSPAGVVSLTIPPAPTAANTLATP